MRRLDPLYGAMLAVTTSLAAAACSGPTTACASGIALHLEVPCCDAHNGALSVEYPPAIRTGYDVDLSGATEGGGVDIPLEMPSDAVAGTAHVAFLADGDGQETFSTAGDVVVKPGTCSALRLDVLAVLGIDAGTP